MPTYDELMAMVHPAVRDRSISGKYAAKMTHDERCAALALLKIKFPRRIVAKVFGVHDRTIASLNSPVSVHYKKVREEFAGLGEHEFIAKYVSKALLQKANDIAHGRFEQVEARATPVPPYQRGPNKMAHQHAGKWTNPNAGWDFEVGWSAEEHNGETIEGWWYRILDDDPKWMAGSVKEEVLEELEDRTIMKITPIPFNTSTQAYNFAMEQEF